MQANVTANPHDSAPDPSNDPGSETVRGASTDAAAAAGACRLHACKSRAPVKIVAVDGDDAISHRLAASGLWVGAEIERITAAPFGDPMLFRVHGYRLALRRSEAERVQVVSVDAAGAR